MSTNPKDWFLPGPERFRRPQAITTLPVVSSVSPLAGRTAGGLSVTITGRNFRNASDGTPPTVIFGGVAATNVVVVDAQTLTCTTPAVDDPERVDVVVTCGSESGTGAGAFVYYEAVVTKIEPAYGPLIGGTDVVITGYNFQNVSMVLFGGVAATNVRVLDGQHITCTTPNHAVGFVDVTLIEHA